eukprot:TRINITY_DN2849_c1_g1_i1.p2 TRINITY_DN2849_c1_g1~~TRINITY_DN2849_c1_g1_i1.p2  ORF type:complete len:383 (+),score=117.00 TRINITY_DN2849_c1_g1_i1:44-1192(+)
MTKFISKSSWIQEYRRLQIEFNKQNHDTFSSITQPIRILSDVLHPIIQDVSRSNIHFENETQKLKGFLFKLRQYQLTFSSKMSLIQNQPSSGSFQTVDKALEEIENYLSKSKERFAIRFTKLSKNIQNLETEIVELKKNYDKISKEDVTKNVNSNVSVPAWLQERDSVRSAKKDYPYADLLPDSVSFSSSGYKEKVHERTPAERAKIKEKISIWKKEKQAKSLEDNIMKEQQLLKEKQELKEKTEAQLALKKKLVAQYKSQKAHDEELMRVEKMKHQEFLKQKKENEMHSRIPHIKERSEQMLQKRKRAISRKNKRETAFDLAEKLATSRIEVERNPERLFKHTQSLTHRVQVEEEEESTTNNELYIPSARHINVPSWRKDL